ncbi:MAG: hypothetical protein ACTTH8_05805 [Treponema sp.]
MLETRTKRLEILEKSLTKKEAELARRIEVHYEDVMSANGQPLNDKRNMQANKRPFHYPPIELLLSDKYKKRSTGKNSQNAKLHGMIRTIANDTGNDFEMVKYVIKQKAMNELGYPTMCGDDGEPVWNTLLHEPFPQSEANCTTVEESLLIEAAYLLAAENGIILP